MMRRRDFIAGLGGAAAWPVVARGQQRGHTPQIIVLMGRAEDEEGRRVATAFREGMRALGWFNGRNIQVDYRWVSGDVDQIRVAAKNVAAQPSDLIVAETTAAVTALSSEKLSTPIVFINLSDPIGGGFVTSLAHPGGMITGFMSNEPTLGSKWPELIKEIAPKTNRIGLLFNPTTSPYAEAFLRQGETAGHSINVELSASPFRDDAELQRVIAALSRDPVSAMIVLPELSTNVRSTEIIQLTARYGLPTLYAYRHQAIGGGLISYGVDLANSFRDAASYVDRILKGEKPADLPVQAPTRFTLVVNLKTAKALNLEVPTSMLLRADEVIE
jgi:putative ABC transport system substrate-binding protein